MLEMGGCTASCVLNSSDTTTPLALEDSSPDFAGWEDSLQECSIRGCLAVEDGLRSCEAPSCTCGFLLASAVR